MRDERSASFAGLSPPEAGRFLRSERSEVAPGSHALQRDTARRPSTRQRAAAKNGLAQAAINQQLHDETYLDLA